VNQVEFHGLEPWPLNDYPNIECDTDDGCIDLHNCYNVGDIVLRLSEGSIFLVLDRIDEDFTPAHYPAAVVLGFLDVRELEVKQAEDFDVRCAGDFEYVMYYLFEDEPRFTVAAGDSLFSFRSQAVVFGRFDNRWDAYRTWTPSTRA
jgi:hypothetical protein